MTDDNVIIQEGGGSITVTESTGAEISITTQENNIVISGGGAPTTLIALTDTPNNYDGAGGYGLRVKSTMDGIEFLPSTDSDEFVKASSNDTTAGYLNNKLMSSDGSVLLSINTPGGNEKIDLQVDESEISHLNISDIGTNTHAQIDTFIGTTVPGALDLKWNNDGSSIATGDWDLGSNELTVGSGANDGTINFGTNGEIIAEHNHWGRDVIAIRSNDSVDVDLGVDGSFQVFSAGGITLMEISTVGSGGIFVDIESQWWADAKFLYDITFDNNTFSSVVTGTSNNDVMVTQGYVDDAISVEDLWDRTGTTLTTHNAGDDVEIDGDLTVGGETNLRATTITVDQNTPSLEPTALHIVQTVNDITPLEKTYGILIDATVDQGANSEEYTGFQLNINGDSAAGLLRGMGMDITPSSAFPVPGVGDTYAFGTDIIINLDDTSGQNYVYGHKVTSGVTTGLGGMYGSYYDIDRAGDTWAIYIENGTFETKSDIIADGGFFGNIDTRDVDGNGWVTSVVEHNTNKYAYLKGYSNDGTGNVGLIERGMYFMSSDGVEDTTLYFTTPGFGKSMSINYDLSEDELIFGYYSGTDPLARFSMPLHINSELVVGTVGGFNPSFKMIDVLGDQGSFTAPIATNTFRVESLGTSALTLASATGTIYSEDDVDITGVLSVNGATPSEIVSATGLPLHLRDDEFSGFNVPLGGFTVEDYLGGKVPGLYSSSDSVNGNIFYWGGYYTGGTGSAQEHLFVVSEDVDLQEAGKPCFALSYGLTEFNWDKYSNTRTPNDIKMRSLNVDNMFFMDYSEDTLYIGGDTEIDGELDMNSNYITDLLDPVNPQDAVTKNYLTTNYADKTYVDNKPWISAKNLGVTGDGVTNDTSTIVAALTTASGNVLYFPEGTYLIDAGEIMPDSTTSIIMDANAKFKWIEVDRLAESNGTGKVIEVLGITGIASAEEANGIYTYAGFANAWEQGDWTLLYTGGKWQITHITYGIIYENTNYTDLEFPKDGWVIGSSASPVEGNNAPRGVRSDTEATKVLFETDTTNPAEHQTYKINIDAETFGGKVVNFHGGLINTYDVVTDGDSTYSDRICLDTATTNPNSNGNKNFAVCKLERMSCEGVCGNGIVMEGVEAANGGYNGNAEVITLCEFEYTSVRHAYDRGMWLKTQVDSNVFPFVRTRSSNNSNYGINMEWNYEGATVAGVYNNWFGQTNLIALAHSPPVDDARQGLVINKSKNNVIALLYADPVAIDGAVVDNGSLGHHITKQIDGSNELEVLSVGYNDSVKSLNVETDITGNGGFISTFLEIQGQYLRATEGLDVAGYSKVLGTTTLQSGGFGLTVGADNNATTLTDSTTKYAKIGMPHYTNSEQKMALINGATSSAANKLNIGGGLAQFNAATEVGIYTATDNITTTGTLRAKWTAAGKLFQYGDADISGALDVDGRFTANGGIVKKIVTKTSNYAVTLADYTILADASSNTVTITLPASPAIGQIFNIKAIDTTYAVTVLGNGKNIDGSSDTITIDLNDSITIQYDSAYGWAII